MRSSPRAPDVRLRARFDEFYDCGRLAGTFIDADSFRAFEPCDAMPLGRQWPYSSTSCARKSPPLRCG